MTRPEPTGKMWMWGIILTVVVFIVFFASFAFWTYQKDVDLVYDNYYDKDVVFEQQIRRVERTNALTFRPFFTYNHAAEKLTLKFPKELNHSAAMGEILLFRPADLHKDRLFPLDLSGDTIQYFSTPDMDSGLWRIKLSWTNDDLEYYLEQALMVKQ